MHQNLSDNKDLQNKVDDQLFRLTDHAESEARGIGATLGLTAFGSLAILITLFIWFESFWYFEPKTKSLIVGILSVIVLLILLGIGSLYWLIKKQKLAVSKPERLARIIGEQLPEIGDKILNAVQLNQMPPTSGISANLHEAAIQAGVNVIEQIPERILFPLKNLKNYLKRAAVGVGVLLVLYFINYQNTNAAIVRLAQPGIQFDYPLPFSLQLLSNSTQILAGDTLILEGQVLGRSVDQVELIVSSKKDTALYILPVIDQSFSMPFNHLMNSLEVTARVKNKRVWEPWGKIESDPLQIHVINRPLVQDLTVRIRPPAYTQLPLEVYTRDIMDISGYRGSQINIEGLASKEIKSASLHFDNNEEVPVAMDGQRFQTQFTLKNPGKIWLELIDDEDVSNLNPLIYPLFVATDIAPLIGVMVPGQDVIIGENLLIPTRLKLDDDFGFSKLELYYQIQHPDYLMADTTRYTFNIDLPQTNQASLELNYVWNLNGVSIMPEDALQYWFVVWDNNAVDGPQEATSKKWLARLPSLDEMFEGLDQDNEQVKQEQKEVLDMVKEIREKVDELALEVQKDPNLSWDQQQEATDAIEQVEQLKDQLENISQQLDEMISSAEEQNLLSEETLDKYSELQELMEQLITPELREAMERLQDAMEQNDPREMEAAMEDFQAAMENFQKNVERTLEIFKQVEIEQKIDELATRLNDLAERQEALNSDLENADASDATQTEEKISNDFDKAQETAEELESLLEQNEDLSSQAVQDLQEQMDQEQISQNLDEAASQMQQGQMSKAQPPAEQAARSLEQMAAQANQMREDLQSQMMNEVMSEFRSALLKTLRLSQGQEALEKPTGETSRQSSLLRDYADSQMGLMQGLQQLAADLKELGNKTFAVSPAMGKSMGAVQAHMQEAVKQLEARNPRKSSQSQAAARESLNRMASQLASSMESLQESGESSGFGDYMDQLQQMAGQQQGLNQQTMMQLGMGNQSMMQQLARQQIQLREALSQIEQGMGSDSRMLGDLGKIGEEMDAVAKELRKKRPSQNIHEQQERILSRLLDAQRSATERDFSKKRKSETAEINPMWLGSGNLPDDLGEARNLLYEELIFSLKQSYTREEQALIREYFNRLEAELKE